MPRKKTWSKNPFFYARKYRLNFSAQFLRDQIFCLTLVEEVLQCPVFTI